MERRNQQQTTTTVLLQLCRWKFHTKKLPGLCRMHGVINFGQKHLCYLIILSVYTDQSRTRLCEEIPTVQVWSIYFLTSILKFSVGKHNLYFMWWIIYANETARTANIIKVFNKKQVKSYTCKIYKLKTNTK